MQKAVYGVLIKLKLPTLEDLKYKNLQGELEKEILSVTYPGSIIQTYCITYRCPLAQIEVVNFEHLSELEWEENFSFVWRHHHFPMESCNFFPILDTQLY